MRVTSPAVTIKAIWDALVADYGVAGSYGALVETNLDAKVSGAKADVSALALEATVDAVATLLSTVAGYLDTEIAAILADVTGLAGAAMRGTDGVDTATMRGTDSAALASAWTAALATILGNFSAARIGYLDNIDSSLKDLFYEHFAFCVDDHPEITMSGNVTDYAKIIDNNADQPGSPTWDTVNRYAELTFTGAVYIKQIRHNGDGSNTGDGRAKLQAYIDGAWVDVLTEIASIKGAWSSWLDLTTPSTAIRWRFTLTTVDTGYDYSFQEIELKGVKLG